VSTLFARLFSVPYFTVTAKATASMRGGVRQPLDIMFVIDSTASMNDNCNEAVRDVGTVSVPGNIVINSSNSKKIDCAKDGIRQFLKSLQPCKLSVNGNCPSTGPNVVDQVALITFPGLVNGNATNHDNTNTRSNFLLSTTQSCSGALTSTPPWYIGGGGFPNKWFLNTSDLSYGSTAAPAVSVVTITQTTGTFTLSYGGQTTSALAWNVNNALTVQNALQALGTIGNGNIGVTKNSAGTVYTLTFQGALGGVAVGPISATATGGSPPPSPTVMTLTGGSGGTNEVQTVTVNQNINFRLRFNGNNTGNIAPGASAATLDAQLESLVSGTGDEFGVVKSGNVFTITFRGTLAATNVSQITMVSGNVTIATTTQGVGPVNEVQAVTVTQTTGTFTLTFSGQTTAPIAFNASAGTVESALENLSNITNNDVVVTRSGAGPYVFTVTFVDDLAGRDVAQMTATASAGVLTQPTVVNNPYQPATTAGYQITQLSNNYRVSNATTALNPASQIVGASYWSSCPGLPTNRYYGLNAVGGVNTYYAGAMQEAQFKLEAAAGRNAQPVIILLSDGDANANASTVPAARVPNQCRQAIDAAVAAASSSIDTLVYSIAYNASRSSSGSCSSDSPRISAFETMRQIARNATTPNVPDPEKFFCLPAASGCTSANTLADVFKKIAADLTSSRLIPDDTS
jgi:hypothetical protein